jgi:hypothetical protein
MSDHIWDLVPIRECLAACVKHLQVNCIYIVSTIKPINSLVESPQTPGSASPRFGLKLIFCGTELCKFHN